MRMFDIFICVFFLILMFRIHFNFHRKRVFLPPSNISKYCVAVTFPVISKNKKKSFLKESSLDPGMHLWHHGAQNDTFVFPGSVAAVGRSGHG